MVEAIRSKDTQLQEKDARIAALLARIAEVQQMVMARGVALGEDPAGGKPAPRKASLFGIARRAPRAPASDGHTHSHDNPSGAGGAAGL